MNVCRKTLISYSIATTYLTPTVTRSTITNNYEIFIHFLLYRNDFLTPTVTRSTITNNYKIFIHRSISKGLEYIPSRINSLQIKLVADHRDCQKDNNSELKSDTRWSQCPGRQQLLVDWQWLLWLHFFSWQVIHSACQARIHPSFLLCPNLPN